MARLEGAFGALGRAIARWPRVAIGVPLVLVALCACGLRGARFVTHPTELYVPQHSQYAYERRELVANFGPPPEPGMLLVRAKNASASGWNVLTPERISELFGARGDARAARHVGH